MFDLERFMREGSVPKQPEKPTLTPPTAPTFVKRDIGTRVYPLTEKTSADVPEHFPTTPWQVEVMDTAYTRSSIPALIGKVFPVLAIQETSTGNRYRIALNLGNTLWLPREVVKVSMAPRYKTLGQTSNTETAATSAHQVNANWNDASSWR